MWQKLKKQLEKIQNSGEATKKRWFIGATAVAMILVVGLWLIYINSTVNSLGNNSQNQEPQGSTTEFWPILKTGLMVVGQSIKEGVKNIISEITRGRTITIE